MQAGSTTQAAQPGAGKLAATLDAALPHLGLDEEGRRVIASCRTPAEALPVLEKAGLLVEATRLVAHALPTREAVWWACMAARHTQASSAAPEGDAAALAAAELWVRKPTEENRRAAMDRARDAGFASAEAWSAVAAFWSGDTMAPPQAPKVPPAPHHAGLAVASAVALAAVRAAPTRRDARLRTFLASARDIVAGGSGRLDPEPA